MSGPPIVPPRNYVIVPIGSRRFSFAAESVIELISIGKLQQFPHRTSWISGVIVRRNRVVPVCDVSSMLGETTASMFRFCLVVEWQAGNARDWCAIPVAGECELTSGETAAEVNANVENHGPHITGSIQVGEEHIEIVDLGKLIEGCQTQSEAVVSEPRS
ncbi:MAG: chemotaxis protein CheW [Candidatus Acidiferrales bacterium]